MRVVGHGSPELIVCDDGSGADGGGTAWQVLHPAAAAVVADDNVELPIGTKFQHAAVVVAAKRLPCVGLKRMQPDQISI